MEYSLFEEGGIRNILTRTPYSVLCMYYYLSGRLVECGEWAHPSPKVRHEVLHHLCLWWARPEKQHPINYSNSHTAPFFFVQVFCPRLAD